MTKYLISGETFIFIIPKVVGAYTPSLYTLTVDMLIITPNHNKSYPDRVGLSMGK